MGLQIPMIRGFLMRSGYQQSRKTTLKKTHSRHFWKLQLEVRNFRGSVWKSTSPGVHSFRTMHALIWALDFRNPTSSFCEKYEVGSKVKRSGNSNQRSRNFYWDVWNQQLKKLAMKVQNKQSQHLVESYQQRVVKSRLGELNLTGSYKKQFYERSKKKRWFSNYKSRKCEAVIPCHSTGPVAKVERSPKKLNSIDTLQEKLLSNDASKKIVNFLEIGWRIHDTKLQSNQTLPIQRNTVGHFILGHFEFRPSEENSEAWTNFNMRGNA